MVDTAEIWAKATGFFISLGVAAAFLLALLGFYISGAHRVHVWTFYLGASLLAVGFVAMGAFFFVGTDDGVDQDYRDRTHIALYTSFAISMTMAFASALYGVVSSRKRITKNV